MRTVTVTQSWDDGDYNTNNTDTSNFLSDCDQATLA